MPYERKTLIPRVEKHPAPEAYVTGFKDFCIEYVLRFWSKQYEQHTAIERHVMRMIWYKFQRRGIEIPFPMSGRLLDNFMQAVHAQSSSRSHWPRRSSASSTTSSAAISGASSWPIPRASACSAATS